MRRLLAVSWEMPPVYGPRGTQVARTLGALVPLGWQPTVVCLDPRRGGPNWRDGVDVPMPAGVEALRVPSPEEWTSVRLLWRVMPWLRDRPDPKWVWIDRAAGAAIAAASRTPFDGLVTFAQPWSSHLAGLRVRQATKLPWVAHFSDPWVDSPYWRGSPAARRTASDLEKQIIGTADAVVFVTQETVDLVMKKYPDEWRKKIAVVPHGFERGQNGPRGSRDVATAPLRLVYTGRFYDGLRTPRGLLHALAALNSEDSLAGVVELTFVGPFVASFARDAKALGVERLVTFRDRVAPGDAQTIAAGADVLVVIDAPSEGPSPFLPSKLVDYLPLRKPILGITPVDGPSATIIRRIGGPVAAPDDEAGIRVALRDLLGRWREGRLGVGPEFDRVAAEYDITATTAKLHDVLTRAFGGRR